MTSSEHSAARRTHPGRLRATTLRPLLGIALLALVVGLGIGRFVRYEPAAATAPAPAAAVTLEARMAELERRVTSDPDDVRGWQLLATTAVARAAETGDPAFYGIAERALDRAEDLLPGAPETLLGRGALALALHEFDAAHGIGLRAVAALPSNAQALGILVDAQVELGHYDDAAATLQTMLDASPDLPALARASYLRELHGDLVGAQRAMREAQLAGSPAPFGQASVLALQGDLFLAGNDTASALTSYEEALRLSPGLVAADVGVARIDAIDGDVAGAIARLEEIVSRIPHPGAAILLSELHAVNGDAAAAGDADQIVRTLARLQEDQGQVVDLEMALFEADRDEMPARAVRLARRAYAARSDNIFTADALAWALHRAGDSAAAVPFAEQAIRLGTADASLRYHAAAILHAAGQPRRAAEQLRAALDLTPWFSFTDVAQKRDLARDLGIPVPPAWTSS